MITKYSDMMEKALLVSLAIPNNMFAMDKIWQKKCQ